MSFCSTPITAANYKVNMQAVRPAVHCRFELEPQSLGWEQMCRRQHCHHLNDPDAADDTQHVKEGRAGS